VLKQSTTTAIAVIHCCGAFFIMELKIDVYFKNKETGKFQIFHEVITEEDIERLAKEKTQDSLPMWMDENWEYESTNVDKVDL
jgi:hypothetical protein